MRARVYRSLAVSAIALFSASLLSATPAGAAERNVSAWQSSEPCSLDYWCLHYRTYAEGAQYNHLGSDYEIEYTSQGGPTFVNRGATDGWEGAGQQVRNNAASANNQNNNRSISVFYSAGYGGNSDRLNLWWAGNLYYTANNNASVRINW